MQISVGFVNNWHYSVKQWHTLISSNEGDNDNEVSTSATMSTTSSTTSTSISTTSSDLTINGEVCKPVAPYDKVEGMSKWCIDNCPSIHCTKEICVC